MEYQCNGLVNLIRRKQRPLPIILLIYNILQKCLTQGQLYILHDTSLDAGREIFFIDLGH